MAAVTEQLTELPMKLKLSKLATEKLSQRAAESGRDVAAVASDLLEQAVAKPSLHELLAVSQAEFPSTGMTRAEAMDFGRSIIEKIRDETPSGS